MEESFIKAAIIGALDNKFFIAAISYATGISSSVIVFRMNDRYKRKNDLRETVTPSINFLEGHKGFTGTKINLDEIQKVRDLLWGHAKKSFDELAVLVREYNLMPRHDSQKSSAALRNFHTEQIVPAINQTITYLKKYE